MIGYLLPEQMHKIASFEDRTLGKFITIEGNVFVGIDNTTGDAWTEEFKNLEKVLKWLNDEI